MDTNQSSFIQNKTVIIHNNTENAMSLVAEPALPVAILMVIVNVITIFVLSRCKHMTNQIKIISINLVATDVLTGLYTFIDIILNMANLHNVFTWCVIRCHFDIGLVTASIFFLGLLATDRVFSLKFAMRYHILASEQRIILASILTWLLAFSVTVSTYINGFQAPAPCICPDNENYPAINLVFRNICFLMIIIAYILMFSTIRKQNRQISCISSNDAKVNIRPVVKITAIVGAVCFMYFPKNIYMIYIVSTGGKFRNSLSWFALLSFIERVNSLINPFLYVWRFKECRIIILKLFGRNNEKLFKMAQKMEYELTGSYMLETVTTSTSPV